MFIMFGSNFSTWRKFRRGRTFAMQQNRGSQNQRLVKTLLLISFLALLSWIPLIIMNTLFVCNCSINWSVYNWASFLKFVKLFSKSTRLRHCQKFGSRWRLRVHTQAIMAVKSYKKMYGDKETFSNISITCMSLRVSGARLET